MRAALPLVRDVLLIGGGHTHALVLRRWGMKPVPGVRVTLVNPEPAAPYTGMLPGHVAGHYSREELDYDLVRLSGFAGARLVLGRVEALDLEARTATVAGRPKLRFDLASLDIGITSALADLPGFETHGIAAKPLGPFAERWRRFLDEEGGHRVVVLGGGIGGVELALAMHHALSAAGRAPEVTVIDNARVLSDTDARPRSLILEAARERGIVLLDRTAVESVDADGVVCGDRRLAADLVVSAAGARPFPWLAETGLDLHEGFVSVGPDLRSSDPAVFAAGDCAHLSHAPRPKAGVFAVRAAPVLDANLRATLSGGRAAAFRPQKSYLKLVSLGRREAVADKWGLGLRGGWVWRWKDRIDRRFMDRLTDLPAMRAPRIPKDAPAALRAAAGPKPLCGGCGAKVGGGTLDRVLAGVTGPLRSDVETAAGDDAAVLLIGDARLVITTDHLRAFWDDPYVMARIAAVHALGDIWSMGAAPQAALAQITLPRMSPELQEATLTEIMAAAGDIFGAEGAAIVGGHTAQGAEMQIGFTVTGLLDGAPLAQDGAQPGDVVILTRPIGTGVTMAAAMAGAASGRTVAAALHQMAAPQGEVARRLAAEATAMTDVTGFGLAGHAWRIARASGVAIEIDARTVPFLPHAEALDAAGHRSTIWADNVAAVPLAAPSTSAEALLFDPQTSGGMLATVPKSAARRLVREPGVHVIGHCLEADAARLDIL